MMISEECKNRIVTWKFAQARSMLTGDETAVEKDVIESLADMLGDSGWFDGTLGVVVDALVMQMVDSVLYTDEEDEPDPDE